MNRIVRINQLDVEAKFLTCPTCKHWLSIPILLHSDGLNYCEACSKAQQSASQRNLGMEHIIATLQFPCKFKNCDYIANLQKIHEHIQTCFHRSLTCPLCSNNIKDNTEVTSHMLNAHADLVTKMSVDEPVAVLNLTTPLKPDTIFFVELKANTETHTFLILVHFVDGTLVFTVGKQTHCDYEPNDNFMIQYQSIENETKIKGKIINHVQLLNQMANTNGKPTISLLENDKNSKEIQLKIYFCNFELLDSVIDPCPICFHRLTAEVHICSNGHSVCDKCITQISDCGICKASMNGTKIDLKRVLSQVPFRCPNAEAGCIYVLKDSELEKHLSDCSYINVKCVKCNETHLKHNIINHMEEKHKVWPNLQNLNSLAKTNPSYNNNYELSYTRDFVKFKNRCFSFKRIIPDGKMSHVNFNVQLLYSNNDREAHQYRYEIHILDKGYGSIGLHKIGNICQSETDDSESSRLNNFAKYLHKVDENGSKLKYRWCIFDS